MYSGPHRRRREWPSLLARSSSHLPACAAGAETLHAVSFILGIEELHLTISRLVAGGPYSHIHSVTSTAADRPSNADGRVTFESGHLDWNEHRRPRLTGGCRLLYSWVRRCKPRPDDGRSNRSGAHVLGETACATIAPNTCSEIAKIQNAMRLPTLREAPPSPPFHLWHQQAEAVWGGGAVNCSHTSWRRSGSSQQISASLRPLPPGRTCGTECVERASVHRGEKWPRQRTGQQAPRRRVARLRA